MDGRGRPRLAFFAGEGMPDPTLDHTLIYLWCDANDCATSDQGWAGNVVAAGHGEAPALALDAEGRPRTAFLMGDGDLGYGWCDEACEVLDTAWATTRVEGGEELAVERPTALPFTCDGEVWEGLAPQLAFEPGGRAVVAYDVAVEARCLYQEVGDPQVTAEFHPLWRGVRAVSLGTTD